VKRWLDDQARAPGNRVAATMRRYAQADARVYTELTGALGWREAA
jgi:hypothetical protein